MMEASSSSSTYRAALSLNNAGVSFLERGYHVEAIAAFKDSLAIMRACMNSSSSTTDNTTNSSAAALEQAIEQKLQACNTKLACMHKRTSNSVVRGNSSSEGGVDAMIEISPIDDGDVCAMRAALSCMSSSCNKNAAMGVVVVVFPIRLRCAAFEKSFDLQAATVLYNVGLAYLLAATYNKINTAQHQQHLSKKLLATGALRNLSMAHSLFSRNIHTAAAAGDHSGEQQQQHHGDAYQRLCAMLVSGLVLKNMFRLFQSQQQRVKAQQVLASLAMLEAALDASSSGRLLATTTMQEQACLASPAA
jgi:hypothetical protein